MENYLVNIPFSGFYGSEWDREIDSAIEMHVYNENERQSSEYETETYQPLEFLRLEESDFSDAYYSAQSFSGVHIGIAHLYAEYFNDWLSDKLADETLIPDLGLRWESMTSPREYNFETDRIFCHIPQATIERLYQLSAIQNHARLADCIKERFTSRSGFISSYSNQIADWTAKPINEWDHNELGTLLGSFVPVCEYGNSLDHVIAGEMDYTLSETIDSLLDAAMDWQKYESDIADYQAAKRADAIENGLMEADNIDPPYRCPLTLDMFDAPTTI